MKIVLIFTAACFWICGFLTLAMSDSQYAVSTGVSDFTGSLIKELRKDHPQNLLTSPFSLQFVFCMLKLGSRGLSSDEIERVMKFPKDDNELLTSWSKVLSVIKEGKNLQDSLSTANKIYLKTGLQLNQVYASTISKNFESEIEQLNFSDSPASAKIINSYVAENTGNKIQNLFEQNAFDALTSLVLVNAIHFKGSWLNKFDPNLTEKKDFFVSETNIVQVDMMFSSSKKVLHANLDQLNAQLISLPFQSENLSMLFLLPYEVNGLQEVEEKLTENSILESCTKLYSRKVEISLPKFTSSSTLNLNQPLKNMGIQSIFDANLADFGGLLQDTKESIHVSQVLQKTFISVDEEGAEAAAATAVKLQKRSIEFPEVFNANHPFVYAILHHEKEISVPDQERTILFYGRFSNPQSSLVTTKDEL